MRIFILSTIILLPALTWAQSFVPNSFSANYEETVISLVTGKEKKSFGKIDYKFPGSLRFEVTSPVSTLFVVNPKKSWLYQPAHVKGEKDQVTIQKSSSLPLIKFLDSVKKGIEGSKLFTSKYDKNNLILTFEKAVQKEMGFIEVILHSAKEAQSVKELKGFDKITLKHLNGSKTDIKLIEFKENVNFGPLHFEFSPPSDAKVITN